MATPEYETTPSEVRKFALLQMALTAGFLVLLYFALGGADADFPPWWLVAALLVITAIGAFLAERVWLSASPFNAAVDTEVLTPQAVGIFAGQIVRKLVYCEVPVLLSVLVAFIGDYGGWPILIVGLPSLLVLAFETWPSLRNTSMTAAMLDADGADSGLVEAFRSW